MAYEKYTWVTGETITAELLNHMEQGIEETEQAIPPVITWENISQKPEFVAEGSTQEEARNSIGAGTSNLEIGTTSSTAAAGNHSHSDYATVTALNDLVARVEALENQ